MLNKKAGSRVYLYVIAGIVVLLIAYLLIASNAPTSGASTNLQSSQSSGSIPVAGVKLSDTPDWNNAHLISGATLDSSTQQAISGFELQRTPNQDGSVAITLKALNPEYSNQKYTVQSGQQLYFIEKSFGDDSPPSGERTTSDDTAVLVDSNGFIVNS